jgi:hypothetical protein
MVRDHAADQFLAQYVRSDARAITLVGVLAPFQFVHHSLGHHALNATVRFTESWPTPPAL